jgi:large subunit ribosomal protein L5
MNNLKKEYVEVVSSKLQTEFAYKNPHEIPKLAKIVISSGLGLKAQNKSFLQESMEEYQTITGQLPVVTKAKKSVAGFKIREKMPLGLVVTLRRERMYAFLEKLIKLTFPRIRDFRGLGISQFDDFGNYSFGISDQLVFPEINFEDVTAKRGFNITIVTTAKTKEESFFLLQELGFPFEKEEKNPRHKF